MKSTENNATGIVQCFEEDVPVSLLPKVAGLPHPTLLGQHAGHLGQASGAGVGGL